jgi:hypothetical protein
VPTDGRQRQSAKFIEPTRGLRVAAQMPDQHTGTNPQRRSSLREPSRLQRGWRILRNQRQDIHFDDERCKDSPQVDETDVILSGLDEGGWNRPPPVPASRPT